MKEYPKDSLFYWYPNVKDLGIPMPKTVMIPFPEYSKPDFKKMLYDSDSHNPYWDQFIYDVKLAALQLGYPVFVRSDETSNKHEWNRSCYVESEDELPSHLFNIMEMTEMVMFGLDIGGFAVREFLELDSKFTAFYGEMPVAREFRFFVKDGRFQCYHPYWFPACMDNPSVDNWYELLMEMESLSEHELLLLSVWADKIGEAVGGYWSVDFCQLTDGSWAMTDMAQGENSFHFNTCIHAPESMKGYPDPYSIPDGLSIDSDNVGKEKNP